MVKKHTAGKQKKLAKQKARRLGEAFQTPATQLERPHRPTSASGKMADHPRPCRGEALGGRDRLPGDRPARGRRAAHFWGLSRGCLLSRGEECLLERGHAWRFQGTDPKNGENPDNDPDLSSLSGEDPRRRGRVRSVLRLPTSPRLPACRDAAQGDRSQRLRHEFTFGRDGKPFYIQGPNESPAQASAIMQRIHESGGHFIIQASSIDPEELVGFEGGDDEFDSIEEEDSPEESP